jgi:NAD(P)-dependent dehydrogenase (short-subunit alcohol dehydrogenase family)
MSHSIIVTGAVRGIGLAVARRLVSDSWRVVAIDVDGGVVSAANEAGATGLVADVTVPADLAAAVATAEEIAPLTGLVNNAAIVDLPRVGFEDISEDEWDAVMSVNVGGVWKATKAAVPAMRRAGAGSVVNISSDTIISGVPGLAHYVASKGAVMAMTRAFASELGTDNIRVNSVALGFTETEAAMSHGDDASSRSVERRAIHRRQMPSDVVGTVAWLLSTDSEMVTGQMVTVNGGYVFH